MKYVKPEMELIRLERIDTVTDSNELPIIPAKDDGELEDE